MRSIMKLTKTTLLLYYQKTNSVVLFITEKTKAGENLLTDPHK